MNSWVTADLRHCYQVMECDSPDLFLLLPAMGRELFAQATVIRSGRTLTVCQAECRADSLETDRVIALMQATIMSLEEREELSEDVEVAQ